MAFATLRLSLGICLAVFTLPFAGFGIGVVQAGATTQDGPIEGVRPPSPALDEQEPETDEGKDELPTIESKTAGMQRFDGFQTFYWDADNGKIWFEIDRFHDDFLYASGLAAGLGSNPVGLDRGQWGRSRVVFYRRVGRRVYLEQRNLRYRANTDNLSEQRAVADSFAASILWSSSIVAQSDERVLVDASSFLLRDAHGVVQTLTRSDQGSFNLDADRSYIHMERTNGFPDNSEFESVLTFGSKSPGARVRETTASPDSVTLRQHHSFVRLPDDGYQPRVFDPRIGGISISFYDYAVPLEDTLHQQWVTRHRLEKKDPTAEMSEAVEPIVYYLDPGAPQPVRDALLEGARWWNEAFESAGFKNGFQVELLPEDADPMDVRYNVIQWVHRSTRGWSYGQSVIDPRTGEIIKGHVLLGSLRVRQDRTIVEGLKGVSPSTACQAGGGEVFDPLFGLDDGLTPTDVALARIRQLSAHEVGHTIGFSHNFAASTYADRASVMDYPAPRIKVGEDGSFDLSDAYGVGVGSWDHVSVKYAYSQFAADADEAAELAKIVQEATDAGELYLSDSDARPAAAAEPRANLWDNGEEPIAELEHLIRVREQALKQFGTNQLVGGRPMSELEQVLVPLYLLHRYQVEAVAKVIGGVEYRYAVQGESTPPTRPIGVERQREALSALLKTLEPSFLAIPDEIRDQIPPKPYGTLRDIERFPSRTTLVFDPLTAAESSADWTLQCILQTRRLNRLVIYSEMEVNELLASMIRGVWMVDLPADRQEASILRTVQTLTLRRMFRLCVDSQAHPDVVAIGRARLDALRRELQIRADTGSDEVMNAHYRWSIERIAKFLDDGTMEDAFPSPQSLPPGSPIGNE